MRRDVFLGSAGFDVSYTVPGVEDIELGIRLVRSGVRIALDPTIQVKHLKRWTLWNMVVTDIRHRGISWMRLILASRQMPDDLNLRISSRVSVAMTALLCILPPIIAVQALAGRAGVHIWPLVLSAATLGSIVVLNFPFYRFLRVQRGRGFAMACLPLHLIYFCCCATASLLGCATYWSQLSPRFSQCRMKPAGEVNNRTQ
jgi:hypothetical protein